MLVAMRTPPAVNMGGNKVANRSSVGPADAFAGFRLNSNGTMQETEATTLDWAIDGGTWVGFGVGSDYEVRFTLNSGSSPTGSVLNTWLSLGTTRPVSISETGIPGTTTSNLLAEIRDATTLAVLDSVTVTLVAEVQ